MCGLLQINWKSEIPNPQSNMTWIKTIPFNEVDEKLRKALEDQRHLYPKEYDSPQPPILGDESIVSTHTLIPDALYHIFSAYGVLLSPDLPLSRRQQEMIATMVSLTNDCFY
jgi:hypothetical protein